MIHIENISAFLKNLFKSFLFCNSRYFISWVPTYSSLISGPKNLKIYIKNGYSKVPLIDSLISSSKLTKSLNNNLLSFDIKIFYGLIFLWAIFKTSNSLIYYTLILLFRLLIIKLYIFYILQMYTSYLFTDVLPIPFVDSLVFLGPE